jgi:two-component system CheB/CheR fusion protein
VTAAGPLVNHVRIREAAFDSAPVPQIVVDPVGSLALASSQARVQFVLTMRDLGRPIQDLEISYRPVELRGSIEQVYAERLPVVQKGVEWRNPAGHNSTLDIQFAPLVDNGGSYLGVSITFSDVTAHRIRQDELQRANRELSAAYEELQSINEELETTNEELRQPSDELNQVNGFLESILTSLRTGVVVVDRDLVVLIWNDRAQDMWGLRAEEVRGKHFLNLDIGLPVMALMQTFRGCLNGDSQAAELTLEATNRPGRHIKCKVACNPLVIGDGQPRGAILLMEEAGDAKVNS